MQQSLTAHFLQFSKQYGLFSLSFSLFYKFLTVWKREIKEKHGWDGANKGQARVSPTSRRQASTTCMHSHPESFLSHSFLHQSIQLYICHSHSSVMRQIKRQTQRRWQVTHVAVTHFYSRPLEFHCVQIGILSDSLHCFFVSATVSIKWAKHSRNGWKRFAVMFVENWGSVKKSSLGKVEFHLLEVYMVNSLTYYSIMNFRTSHVFSYQTDEWEVAW